MLIRFKFQNYRSFRDENILSMEAKGNSEYKNCLIPYKKKGLFLRLLFLEKTVVERVMLFVHSG